MPFKKVVLKDFPIFIFHLIYFPSAILIKNVSYPKLSFDVYFTASRSSFIVALPLGISLRILIRGFVICRYCSLLSRELCLFFVSSYRSFSFVLKAFSMILAFSHFLNESWMFDQELCVGAGLVNQQILCMVSRWGHGHDFWGP